MPELKQNIEIARLEVAMASLGGDAVDVSVNDFITELSAIEKILSAIDEDINARKTMGWKVVDLHHSRPTVVLGAFPFDDKIDASQVLGRLFRGIPELTAGRDAIEFGQKAIDGVRDALKPIGRALRGVQLKWDAAGQTNNAEIGIELKSAFDRVSFKSEFFDEEWEGLIEEMNVHPKTPTFKLYPAVAPKILLCAFPREKIEEYKGALTHKVSVAGKAVYRPLARFPHKVDVHELIVLDKISPEGLQGLAGIYAGDRNEMFDALKQARDGWEYE